jgi:poly-gamma-glutamate synthesis protein (capsule biosynthesis protein)
VTAAPRRPLRHALRFFVYLICAAAIGLVARGALLVALGRSATTAVGAPATVTRPAARAGEARLLFAGDTALVDVGLEALTAPGGPGLDAALASAAPLVAEADLAIVNHEAPITARGFERLRLWKEYRYRAPPESAAALARAGVDVLGLANNHAGDAGAAGIDDTRAAAAAAGMVTIGAGADPADARRGLVATIGDQRVGLLAYCEDQLLWRAFSDQPARAGHAGVATATDDELAADVARLRAHGAGVVIVLLHGGETYAPPTERMLAWARRAIDRGADAVVAHHPHLAHPVALHRGRPILLSIGNLAFGTRGHPSLDIGLLATLVVERGAIARVELAPVRVQNREVAFRPRLLDGREAEEALAPLAAASRALGATVHVGGGRAVVDVAGAP